MRQIIDEFGDSLLHMALAGAILSLTTVILAQLSTVVANYLTGLIG